MAGEDQAQPIESFVEVASTGAALSDTVSVLENLVNALRKHHGIKSKSEARAIIREALMEI